MTPKGTPEYWAESHPWLTLLITTPITILYLCIILACSLIAIPCMLIERLLDRTQKQNNKKDNNDI